MGGLSLPEILRAESAVGVRNSKKAVIMVYLPGGPAHQDLIDLKPDAPAEIRGEFSPIKTNVPGIEICELLPRLSKVMDKMTLIRSIVGAKGDHYATQCWSGRDSRKAPPGGWPCMGSVISKLKGPMQTGVPAFVNLSGKTIYAPWSDPGQPGFLGVAHAPFRPEGDGKGDMVLNGVNLNRLGDRKTLLSSFDRFRRDADSSGMMDGVDSFNQQAFGVLTSSRLMQALDISQEDPRVRERYGKGDPNNRGDGGANMMEYFLMARRLVEAGTRCVTLAFGRWDWHFKTFKESRYDFPMFDQGLAALVQDLYDRGLDKDVSVVIWGEFGRTPRINANAGRDHWPAVSCAMVAGGGMRMGQIIGSTDRLGGQPKSRPVHFQEVFATLYQRLGLDANQITLPDLAGRPQYLVDHYEPIRELI